MRKAWSLGTSLVLVAVLAGCGGDAPHSIDTTTGVADVLEAGIAEADSAPEAKEATDAAKSGNADTGIVDAGNGETVTGSEVASTDRSAGASGENAGSKADAENEKSEETAEEQESDDGIYEGKVDVDLTSLSSTMVYSEVYNMIVSPRDYIGKVVKMQGIFTYFQNPDTEKYYFACIIQDATACCAQGIEFEPKEEYVFPDDFPAAAEDVAAIGVFDTYEEDGFTYNTLRDAIIIPCSYD